MIPTHTANNKYSYKQIYYKKSLDKWINEIHKYNSKHNHWFYRPLKKGSYGYDTMAYCIAYTLEHFSYDYTLEELAEIIHESWSEIYCYWRDYKPYLNNNYIKPAKPLNDYNRNLFAETSYNKKPIEEKEKDLIIAEYIFNSFHSLYFI
jgi:hypothetical protein